MNIDRVVMLGSGVIKDPLWGSLSYFISKDHLYVEWIWYPLHTFFFYSLPSPLSLCLIYTFTHFLSLYNYIIIYSVDICPFLSPVLERLCPLSFLSISLSPFHSLFFFLFFSINLNPFPPSSFNFMLLSLSFSFILCSLFL